MHTSPSICITGQTPFSILWWVLTEKSREIHAGNALLSFPSKSWATSRKAFGSLLPTFPYTLAVVIISQQPQTPYFCSPAQVISMTPGSPTTIGFIGKIVPNSLLPYYFTHIHSYTYGPSSLTHSLACANIAAPIIPFIVPCPC